MLSPPPQPVGPARILVVDDIEENRRLLVRLLTKVGYVSQAADGGVLALHMLRDAAAPFDLVLLDLEMPDLNGIEVLRQIRADPRIAATRVVMVSGIDDVDQIAACIELGADDFIAKPWDSRIIMARIRSSLDRKLLHDWEERYVNLLQEDEALSSRLISNMIPDEIATRLKHGETTISEYFDDVSILFADIVGFTKRAAITDARALVAQLNRVFSRCDELVKQHGLEKIKTIGDAYMVAGSLPQRRADHLIAMADVALELVAAVHADEDFEMRVGIHCGPAVAGVIGTTKLTYDVWGDTINIASRMESHGEPRRIHVSAAVRDRLDATHRFEPRGVISVKGVGPMVTHFLVGRK